MSKVAKISKIALAIAATSLTASSAYADLLTNLYGQDGKALLVNAQVKQVSLNGAVDNHTSIGYFEFDGNGKVTHKRLEISPKPWDQYLGTKVAGKKHINVDIEELYGYDDAQRGHTIDNACDYVNDAGELHRSTVSQPQDARGTYSYNETNGILTVDVGDTVTQWQKSSDANASAPHNKDGKRWQLRSTTQTSGTVQNSMGYAYFSTGYGHFPTNLKRDFDQGMPNNSARGYIGELFSNSWNEADKADDRALDAKKWISRGRYETENAVDDKARINLYALSNHSINFDRNYSSQLPGTITSGVYSKVWYYNVFNTDHIDTMNDYGADFSKGLFVQSSYLPNEFADFPTMVVENTGHMFHEFAKNGKEAFEAFDSRHCWTDSDTNRTQGHTLLHLGAMDESRVSHMVTLEVTKNRDYPIISLGYSRSTWEVDELFVEQTLKDILGDAASPTTVDTYEQALHAAGKRSTWIKQLMNDTRFKDQRQQLSGLYYGMLLRAPDQGGLGYWESRLTTDLSLAQIADNFGASGEFQTHWGSLSTEAFVIKAYNEVLNREPDAGGKAFFIGQLDTNAMTRARVLYTLIVSGEFQPKMPIVALYGLLAQRTPTSAELTEWQSKLDAGTDIAELIAQIITGDSFLSRFE